MGFTCCPHSHPELMYANESGVQAKISEAEKQRESGPLEFVVDIVPDNAFAAMSDNSRMLQVIFFTVLLGISMLLVTPAQAKPLKAIFDSLNEVVLKMVDLIGGLSQAFFVTHNTDLPPHQKTKGAAHVIDIHIERLLTKIRKAERAHRWRHVTCLNILGHFCPHHQVFKK